MVMERIHGMPISQIDALRALGVDLKRLSRAGVEIFFTQVFSDGVFHADMHPGNILVTPEGPYVALDFGIMDALSAVDKHYLGQNFIASFRRDYRRVAVAHVELDRAQNNTDVDDFEAAIRTVCERIERLIALQRRNSLWLATIAALLALIAALIIPALSAPRFIMCANVGAATPALNPAA